jgi:putative ABC transport system substrate-binding protein
MLAGLAAFLVARPRAAAAQSPTKTFLVGYFGVEASPSPYLEAFRDGLRRLGYVEGRNVAIESRLAEGRAERLPALVSELIDRKVDVIVGITGGAAFVASKATTTIPIVVGVSGDPVEAGLVASFARPGGNITGMSYLQPELSSKRLQLLKEVVPKLTRVAMVANASHPGEGQEWRALEVAAKTLGVVMQKHMMPAQGELGELFGGITADRPDALMVVPGPITNVYRQQLAEFGLKSRLPTMAGWSEYVDAGSLLSYGPSRRDISRRLASFVDRVFRGEKPAQLPVERPTRFDMAVNLRTARALGITIPPSLLLQADHVID